MTPLTQKITSRSIGWFVAGAEG